MEVLEILQSEWAIRALIASVMVGVMCGVLGVFIVLRNMSLIGDALSHAVLPGVVFGFVVAGYSILGFFLGAVLAGLISAIGITWLQQNVKTKNDAAIGIVFTAMFSLGVMWISRVSREGNAHLDLDHFLFGNVLGVSNEDLYLTGFILVYVLVSIVVFYRYLFATTFQSVIAETMGISVKTVYYFLMLLLSFAVVASLKMVGVILVVAMLITPAATALLLSNRLQTVLVIAGLLGMVSAILGLVIAIILDTTPGPAMTVVATLLYLIAVFFAPQKGLVFKYFHKRQNQKKIQLEDTLKQAFKLHEQGELNINKLRERLGIDMNVLNKNLNESVKQGWMLRGKQSISLTEVGKEQANRLIRAHRLWETYQVNQLGLNSEQIHDDAEHYEHVLTDEILDEIDTELGYPDVDPHGSPIPKKNTLPKLSLAQIENSVKIKILSNQLNEYVTAQLWRLGLLPNVESSVKRFDDGHLEIQQGKQMIRIPMKLATKIGVEKIS